MENLENDNVGVSSEGPELINSNVNYIKRQTELKEIAEPVSEFDGDGENPYEKIAIERILELKLAADEKSAKDMLDEAVSVAINEEMERKNKDLESDFY